MFLLIVAIPFILFLKTENTKTDKVKFVEAKENTESRDTIKLFEVIDGKEEEYLMDFNIGEGKRAYFYRDTVGIRLFAGSLGGYNLSIKLTGEEYTSKLTNYSCTWREDLKIKEQRLEFEDFRLVHNGKLKGNYYCEANHKNKFTGRVDKVRIRGHFVLDLIDEAEEAKKWQ